MSGGLFPSDVLFGQRFLACQGFKPGPLDGKYGRKTDTAWTAFFASSSATADAYGRFDPVSERCIGGLMLPAQHMARRILTVGRKAGVDVRVLSGVRTYAEQTALYAKGRTAASKAKGERIVTNAKAGSSLHNFAVAVDVGVFQAGRYIVTAGPYRALAAAVLPVLRAEIHVEWGGDWHGIVDVPHFQVVGNSGVAAIRAKFEAGQNFIPA